MGLVVLPLAGALTAIDITAIASGARPAPSCCQRQTCNENTGYKETLSTGQSWHSGSHQCTSLVVMPLL